MGSGNKSEVTLLNMFHKFATSMGNVGVEKDEGGVYTVVDSVNALPHESTKDTAGFNVGINVIHHHTFVVHNDIYA